MPSPADKDECIGTVARLLRECYVFPDSGATFSTRLQELQRQGRYDGAGSEEAFVRLVAADLEEISHDRHLALLLDPEMNAALRKAGGENEADEQFIEEERKRNYGLRQAAVLDGNVGYLDLRIFVAPWAAGPTVAAAMAFLANCDAFIIDLRHNGGGWGEMVALLSSYFFSGREQVHLSSTYSRPDSQLTQSWTAPWVPGPLFPDRPLFILTSKSTFSAAEEFCYNMKQLKRAVLVGETTRGGAHPVSFKPVGARYVLRIPEMTSVNPISGSNWEGVGVEPDLAVPAERALAAAHVKVLQDLLAAAHEESRKRWLLWHVEACVADYQPVAVPDSLLQTYPGHYGPIVVDRQESSLSYSRGGRMPHRLRPISATLFADRDADDLRVEFILEDGAVTGLNVLTETGDKSGYPRQ